MLNLSWITPVLRSLRGQLVVLFFVAFIGCLGGDSATKSQLLFDEDGDGLAYSPPTPIFRDIRIVASADHLTTGLPAGSTLDTFTLALDDIALTSSESDDDLSLPTDQGLLLDLTAEEPTEIVSTRLLQNSPYDEVVLTFSSMTIEGSFTTNGQTYRFKVNSTEAIQTTAAIPEEVLAFAINSNLQALTFSESLAFDLNITLPTLETYREMVAELEDVVLLYNLPPDRTIEISEDSDDPIAQSVRRAIRNGFERAASPEAIKKTKPSGKNDKKDREEAHDGADEIEESEETAETTATGGDNGNNESGNNSSGNSDGNSGNSERENGDQGNNQQRGGNNEDRGNNNNQEQRQNNEDARDGQNENGHQGNSGGNQNENGNKGKKK